MTLDSKVYLFTNTGFWYFRNFSKVKFLRQYILDYTVINVMLIILS